MGPLPASSTDSRSAGQCGNFCCLQPFSPIHLRRRVYSWLDSIWLQLAISAVFGLLYMLLVMGREPLNPRNIDWLGEDGAHHYIGWEMLRQDPHWHWPLMYSDRLGYPVGESVALVDVNPWMALPFKMFSPLLPEPFQYFGIEAVLCCALQFFVRTEAVSAFSWHGKLCWEW